MISLEASHLDDLPKVAQQIIAYRPGQKLFCFFGKMGAGKTSLIKAFCAVLGSSDIVNSPTFSIVNEYDRDEGSGIFHFDFYRINRLEEIYDIGFDEYLESGNYCLMEWPEKILELLPLSYVKVLIDVREDETRLIRVGDADEAF
jgi:tRNA threonylcarbamoyladenosine biosynthesis protein TsaE